MYLLRHDKIHPIFIVGSEVDYITLELHKQLKKDYKRKYLVIRQTECHLDPGGLLVSKIPFKKIEIDGYTFTVQLSRVESAIALLVEARETIKNYLEFPSFHYNVFVRKTIGDRLLFALLRLEKTDAALNAELDELTVLDNLNKKPPK